MNLMQLQRRAEEWKALKQILEFQSPDGRWQLLHIWLRQRGDWQLLISEILEAQTDGESLSLVIEAIGLSENQLWVIDPDRQMRAEAIAYIRTLKQLYFDRLAADLPARQLT